MKIIIPGFILFILTLGTYSCSSDKKHDQPIIDSAKVNLLQQKDSVPLDEIKTDSLHSEITCPKCGFKKTELLPTEVCQLKYTCQACRYEMVPKEGDCCVFCTYGNIKCPSKQ